LSVSREGVLWGEAGGVNAWAGGEGGVLGKEGPGIIRQHPLVIATIGGVVGHIRGPRKC